MCVKGEAEMKPGDLRFVSSDLLFVFEAEDIPEVGGEDSFHSIPHDGAIFLIEKGKGKSGYWRVLTCTGIGWASNEDLNGETRESK